MGKNGSGVVRGLAWAGGAAAVLAGAGLAGVLAAVRGAEAAWEEMEQRAGAARREWEARDFRRPALWGETVPGSALASYRAAVEQTRAVPLEERDRLAALAGRPDRAEEGEIAAHRARWAPVLAVLREGAQREDARPEIRFEKGFHHPVWDMLNTRRIVDAAVLEAHALRAAGRGREAVEVLLDAATFGADLTRSPMPVDRVIGAVLVAVSTANVWTDEALRSLDREALAVLEEGLERLDPMLPQTIRYEEELILMAHHVLAMDRGDLREEAWEKATWRFAFSRRWMLADAFRKLSGMARALQEEESLRWPEREALLARMDRRIERDPNLALRRLWPGPCRFERNLRQILTHVRLLRLAVAAHQGRAPAPLADPLGHGDLAVHATAGGLRFTSEGSGHEGRLERPVSAR